MEIALIKTSNGFVPADTETEKWAKKLQQGRVIHSNFTQMRNYKFFKKWFALLNIGFDNWSPNPLDNTYGIPEKNFSRFRSDVIILCGFYDTVIRLDGSVRIEPKSVSFAKMTEDTFRDLYSKTIDVMLKYVYNKDMDREKLDSIVNQYLSFT